MIPKISVIMSVYNDEEYLCQAIDSILNQTYEDFELLITDDDSTDGSKLIIKKYEEKDNRIRVFYHSKNRGLPVSLNEMIKMAKGNYIARMDSDDIAYPTRFEEQIKKFNEEDVDFVFSNTVLMTREETDLCDNWMPKNVETIKLSLNYHNYIPHPTVMVKREILLENPYNENCRRGQDTELWRRLVDKGIRFEFIDKGLLRYRLNPRNVEPNFYYANTCIANSNKRKSIAYLRKISDIRNVIKIIVKLLVPHSILRLHSKLLDRI